MKLKRLGIDTYKEAVIYMHENCPVCHSEGFEVQARIEVTLGRKSIIATLNTINSDLLGENEASLSDYAWNLLSANVGDTITLSHPKPLNSLSSIHSKIYGHELSAVQLDEIIKDIVSGKLSDIQISAFLSASAGTRFSLSEIIDLTSSMIKVGQRLHWDKELIVDKHCVGGLPGNRTSLLVVPIVAAFGLTIPKTSSRAITSPAGSADTMEVFTNVSLDLKKMRDVVEKENGCIVWGGAVSLSPADDILIRVEHAIDLDSEAQLVSSILSKKVAAGSNHILIDIPIGDTAKVRSQMMAKLLKKYLEKTGEALGVTVSVIFTEGSQPVGRGIGPALEAKDVLSILRGDSDAPKNLRDRALDLAGKVLEFSNKVKKNTGRQTAQEILNSGKALKKFEMICEAQGGMKELPTAKYTHAIYAKNSGRVSIIDNRRIARVAKLAGAPNAKAAGVELLTPLHTAVEKAQPLFIIHAETRGELEYAVKYVEQTDIITLES
jgi:thymidine phosphorylase